MKKQRKPQKACLKTQQVKTAEQEATKAFYAGLQEAIAEVDWRQVKLPLLRDLQRVSTSASSPR